MYANGGGGRNDIPRNQQLNIRLGAVHQTDERSCRCGTSVGAGSKQPVRKRRSHNGSALGGLPAGGEERMFNLKGREQRTDCVNLYKSGFTPTYSKIWPNKSSRTLMRTEQRGPSPSGASFVQLSISPSQQGGGRAAIKGLHVHSYPSQP